MRVIAGTARGVSLTSPRGTGTRPITDRVKETLFAILGERVPDARALDLYAGSGAIGIEALSRGAANVVFVTPDVMALVLQPVGEASRPRVIFPRIAEEELRHPAPWAQSA